MGTLADRCDELSLARTQVINRLHRLLLELLPGGAKKFLSARQARALVSPSGAGPGQLDSPPSWLLSSRP